MADRRAAVLNRQRAMGTSAPGASPWAHDDDSSDEGASGGVMLTADGVVMKQVGRTERYRRPGAPWEEEEGVHRAAISADGVVSHTLARTSRYEEQSAPWDREGDHGHIDADGARLRAVPRSARHQDLTAPWGKETAAQYLSAHSAKATGVMRQRPATSNRDESPWEQGENRYLSADGRSAALRPVSSTGVRDAAPWESGQTVSQLSANGASALKAKSPGSRRGPRRRTGEGYAPRDEEVLISTNGRGVVRAQSAARKVYPRGRQHAPWAAGNTPDAPGMVLTQDGVSLQSRTVYKPRRTDASVAMNPDLSDSLAARRRGVKQTKDHLKDNVRQLRKMQASNRRKGAAASGGGTPTRPASRQYAHVESKVSKKLQTPSPSRPTTGSYLRKGSRAGPPSKPHEPVVRRPQSAGPIRDTPPEEMLTPRRPTSAASARRPSSASGPRRSKKKGEVPAYLKKRQAEWQQEAAERERLETLQVLRAQHHDLEAALQSLSLSADTVRHRQENKRLLTELDDVENAIRVFSKAKVFVPAE